MALFFPISRSLSLNGSSAGNFLSQRTSHLVVPDGNELVFYNIQNADQKPIRTPLFAPGVIISVHRLTSDPTVGGSLDAMLVYSRLTAQENAASNSSEDIFTIKRLNRETMELDTLKSERIPVQAGPTGSSEWAEISLKNVNGEQDGSFVVSNGYEGSVFLGHAYDNKPLVSLRHATHLVKEPSKAYWVSDEHFVVVTETSFASSLVFFDLKLSPAKAKSTKPTIVNMPDRIKHVGSNKDGIIVIFSAGVRFFKYNKKGVKNDKEFNLDLKSGVRKWNFLLRGNDTDLYYISSSQDVLMWRKGAEPTLLKVQNTIPGPVKPIGLDLYLLPGPTSTNLLRYKFNKQRTNITAEFMGTRPNPADNLTLLGTSSNKEYGRVFWWRSPEQFAQKLYVSRPTLDTPRTLLKAGTNETVTTFCAVGSQQYMLSTQNRSFMVKWDEKKLAFAPVPNVEMKTDAETLYANLDLQITAAGVFKTGREVESAPTGIIMAKGSASCSVVVQIGSVSVYNGTHKEHELSAEDIGGAVIDVACYDHEGVVLTQTEVFKVGTGKRMSLDGITPTSVLMISDDQVLVGTTNGSVVRVSLDGASPRTNINVSQTPITSLFSVGDQDLCLVSDALSTSYLVSEEGEVRALTFEEPSAVTTLDDKRCFVLVDGFVHLADFSSLETEYSTMETPEIAEANEIQLDSKLNQLNYESREITVTSLEGARQSVKYVLPESPEGSEWKSQLRMLGSDYVLEVANKSPEDEVSDDAEMDDFDAAQFFEVELAIRLYKLSTEGDTPCAELVAQEKLTIEGDPYEEIIIKLVSGTESTDRLHFWVFAHSAGAAHGIVTKKQASVQMRKTSSHISEDIYFDHWFCDTDNRFVIIDQVGNFTYGPMTILDTVEYPSTETLQALNSRSLKLPAGTQDMVSQAVLLGQRDGPVYAVALRQQTNEQMSHVFMFTHVGIELKILASLLVPSRRLTLIPSDRSFEAGTGPDFYMGTQDGTIMAVCSLGEAAYEPLARVQQGLLEDAGFSERLEQLSGKVVDGSLLANAVPDFDDFFEKENITSQEFMKMVETIKI